LPWYWWHLKSLADRESVKCLYWNHDFVRNIFPAVWCYSCVFNGALKNLVYMASMFWWWWLT